MGVVWRLCGGWGGKLLKTFLFMFRQSLRIIRLEGFVYVWINAQKCLSNLLKCVKNLNLQMWNMKMRHTGTFHY